MESVECEWSRGGQPPDTTISMAQHSRRTAERSASNFPPTTPFLSHLQPVLVIYVIAVCVYHCCDAIDINLQPQKEMRGVVREIIKLRCP